MSSKWTDGWRRAFAFRLGLWYAALFVASAMALAVFTYLLLARALAAQDHDVLEGMLGRYATEFQRSGLPGLESLIESDAGEGRHERLLVRLVDRRTEVVYFATPRGLSAFDLAILDAPDRLRSGWSTIGSRPDGTVLEVGTLVLPQGVAIQVGRSSRVRDELLAQFRARAFQVALLVVLTALAGGVALTHLGLAPIRSLDRTLRSILQTGRFDARVETRASGDALDELGGRVNEMLARIQALVTGMRSALDNVAHDLRTPLTRFRNVAESALIAGDEASVRHGLVQAVEEADRLNATLRALMDISEAETGTMKLAYELLDVAAVVGEAVDLYQDEADDKGVTLAATVPDGLAFEADRTRLRQVLANLVENAVKYTDGGGRVDVQAIAAGDTVRLTVRDTGLGIAPEHLPHVWDRLYRADPSRSARGLGLGLSLVKAIVEAHGGRVDVTSAPGAGSTFGITLPAKATR